MEDVTSYGINFCSYLVKKKPKPTNNHSF